MYVASIDEDFQQVPAGVWSTLQGLLGLHIICMIVALYIPP